jgi:hypothetical protein
MAIPNRSYLFCLLLLASLPVDGAAALAVANAQGSAALPGPSLSIEERLSRIAAAVQQQGGVEEAPGGGALLRVRQWQWAGLGQWRFPQRWLL